MDYHYHYHNILEKDVINNTYQKNILSIVKKNKFEECQWHSNTLPNSNDITIENDNRLQKKEFGYKDYDEECEFKFIYDFENNKCYDNCNHKNRMTNLNIARIKGDQIIALKKLKMGTLLIKKNEILKNLEKNSKLIDNIKKQIKKLESQKCDKNVKQKNQELINATFITEQLKNRLSAIINEIEINEFKNLDPIILGQMS